MNDDIASELDTADDEDAKSHLRDAIMADIMDRRGYDYLYTMSRETVAGEIVLY